MTAAQRGWLVSVPAGIAISITTWFILEDRGSKASVGPVDVLGMIAIASASVYVLLPRSVIFTRRMTRMLGAWSTILFFLMLAEAAHQCTSADPTCTDGGEPLLVFAVWAGGFAVLCMAWLLTDPRRRRRRRPRKRKLAKS